MKQIFSALLLLAAFAASAQTVTFDTTFYTRESGVLFENVRIEYDNKGITTSKQPVDSVQIITIRQAEVKNWTNDQLSAFRQIQQTQRLFTSAVRADKTLFEQLGVSFVVAIHQENDVELLKGQWEQVINGTATDVNVRRRASDGLSELRPTGGQFRTFRALYGIIRVTNWPTQGAETILYQVGKTRYVDLSGTIVLRRK
jgi:hypothetical protein